MAATNDYSGWSAWSGLSHMAMDAHPWSTVAMLAKGSRRVTNPGLPPPEVSVGTSQEPQDNFDAMRRVLKGVRP